MPPRTTNAVRSYADGIYEFASTYDSSQFESAFNQLRGKERIFVDAFLAFDNPRNAALAAYPELETRPSLADVRAIDFMKRPLVKAAIAEKLRVVMDRYEVTTDRVVQEIAKIGFASMGDYIRVTSDGDPMVDLSGLTPEQMAAISEVTVEDYTEGRGEDAREIRRVKFKLHDKLSGLDKLMKRLGAYAPDKIEHAGPGGGPIRTANINADIPVEDLADLYSQSLREGNDDD
jgi:phage terminase small subunit